MNEKLKERLVPEARQWWRLSSVHLSAARNVAMAVLFTNPEILLMIVALLPIGTVPRLVLTLLVFGIFFGWETLTRLWTQPELNKEEADDQAD